MTAREKPGRGSSDSWWKWIAEGVRMELLAVAAKQGIALTTLMADTAFRTWWGLFAVGAFTVWLPAHWLEIAAGGDGAEWGVDPFVGLAGGLLFVGAGWWRARRARVPDDPATVDDGEAESARPVEGGS